MKILIACDSFKGCCSSQEAAAAIRRGILEVYPDADIREVLIADGGEGTMLSLLKVLKGCLIHVSAHDALMRPIDSVYGLLPDSTALLEVAETGGLTRLQNSECRPLEATTYGLGEQMADALQHGCTHMLIGLGGSATTDAGQGMLQALIDKNAVQMAQNCRIEVLCDVRNPLFGPEGAAYVFGPQKGASSVDVQVLDKRLRELAAGSPHPELAYTPGAGAAGGLGFALMAYLGGHLVSGIDTILRCQSFEQVLQGADLVITGEGSIDRQTLTGKAPFGVMRHASAAGVPAIALAGRVEHTDELLAAGFHRVVCINPPATPLEQAMNPVFAAEHLRLTTIDFLKNEMYINV